VKMRVHPGRVEHNTLLPCNASSALTPEWNDKFVCAWPKGRRSDAEYVPCLSFR
jgi:hypothetical protein